METNELLRQVLTELQGLNQGQTKLEQRFGKLEQRFDKLEQRVGSLESDVKEIKANVASLKTDMAAVKEHAEVTRAAVNSLIEWADRAEHSIKLPFPVFA